MQSETGVPPTGRLTTRNLTVLHAVGQALAIGPIFSAGLLTSLIASVAGYSTPLAVLLGSIGAVGLAYVIGIFGKRYSGAGSMYEYLARGGSPAFGIFSAGLYFIGSLFLGAGGIYLAIGFFGNLFDSQYLGGNIPFWVFGGAILIIVFLLNHYGVRIAIRGVLLLAAISSIPLLIVVIAIIASGGVDGNTLAVFSTAHSSWSNVFHGILFAVTLFIGFEAAAAIAEETHAPKRSIPLAVMLTVVLAAVFYILVSYAAAIGFGHVAIAKGVWAESGSPIAALATKYVGGWLGTIVDLVIILDMISLSIAIMVSTSRGFFALGRDGLLPRWLSNTSRHGTPLSGNLIVLGWSALILIWGGLQQWGKAAQLPNVLQNFLITTAAGSYLIELIYLFLAVVALRILYREYGFGARHLWKYVVVLLGLVTPILAFVGSLSPFPTYPNNLAVYFAGIVFILVAIWTAGLAMQHAERVKAAATYSTVEDI